MNMRQLPAFYCCSLLIGSALLCAAQETSAGSSPVSVATSPVAAPTGQPSEADMMKQMMELSKLNENHKMLTSLDGNWSYTVKMWMDGDNSKKPMESKGTAVRKGIMDGRFV